MAGMTQDQVFANVEATRMSNEYNTSFSKPLTGVEEWIVPIRSLATEAVNDAAYDGGEDLVVADVFEILMQCVGCMEQNGCMFRPLPREKKDQNDSFFFWAEMDTFVLPKTRDEIYKCIAAERTHQDNLPASRTVDALTGRKKTLRGFVMLLDHYAHNAMISWCNTAGDQNALIHVRKIAALATACLEAYGDVDSDIQFPLAA